jgi:hypothetical protein
MSVAKGRIGAFTVWWVFIAALLALAAGCSGGGQSPGVPADDSATGTPEASAGPAASCLPMNGIPMTSSTFMMWGPDGLSAIPPRSRGKVSGRRPWCVFTTATSRIEPNGW